MVSGVDSYCRIIQRFDGSVVAVFMHRNQQYSIIALTDGSGAVGERYAYSAFGTPTITDASGTARTTTAVGNHYTSTGREWDAALALYHYRARMYDSVAGRFCSSDPIKFEGSKWNVYEYANGRTLVESDPSGLGVITFIKWVCKKTNTRKTTTVARKLERRVVMPTQPATPPGKEFLNSELIGESGVFKYRDRITGKVDAIIVPATIIGTATCTVITVTEFLIECSPVGDAIECGKFFGRDYETKKSWGFDINITPGGDCRVWDPKKTPHVD